MGWKKKLRRAAKKTLKAVVVAAPVVVELTPVITKVYSPTK
jgi:hypothetical protein